MPAMPYSESMEPEAQPESQCDHISYSVTSDLDTMAEYANTRKESSNDTRADVKAKLKESDRKWAQFIQDSHSDLREHLSQVSSRHSEYLLGMTGLHKGLHEHIKDLARVKSDLRKFVCPSALESFETSIEKLNSPRTIGSSPDKGKTPRSMSILTPKRWVEGVNTPDARSPNTLEDPQDFVTRTVLRDDLFHAMTPLYGLQETLSSSLIPIYEEIQRMGNIIGGEFVPEHPDVSSDAVLEGDETAMKFTTPAFGVGATSGNVELMNKLLRRPRVADASRSGSAASSVSRAMDMGKTGSLSRSVHPKVRESTMHRAHSHLNFAVNLVGGHVDESFDLMSVMHEYKLPSKRKLLCYCMGYEPDRTTYLAKLLTSTFFEKCVSVVILLNMVHITHASDYAVTHPHDQSNDMIKIFEVTFQLFYFIELIFKLFVHRLYFFIDHDWHWNWLDFILVSTACYDLFMTLTGQNWETNEASKSQFNLTFLRVLRLARFSKVVRIFRVVRFVNELHILVKITFSTIKPMFWCSVVLAVFFYLFSVIFVNATTTYLATDNVGAHKRSAVLKHWGSVAKAMVTLYQASTGGKDWGEPLETLADVGNIYYCLFLFFIGFVILALLNILTGIFVEAAMKASAADKDGQAYARLMQECSTVIDLAKLHCVMSGQEVEENGSISLEDFEFHMSSPAVWARFSVMGLEIWDSQEFFLQLSALAGSETVDLKTFVAGCLQMRGTAQRVSLQSVAAQVDFISELLEAMSSGTSYGNRRPSKAATMVSPSTYDTNGAKHEAV